MSSTSIGVFDIYDDSFLRLICPTATLHRLHTGLTWAEGPAYFPALRLLIFSDVPENRLLRYDECNGQTSIFRSPSQHSNGNTVDRQGRLITCEHQTRRVTRTEHDGTITILADRDKDGKRFNSPNDIVVKSDGSVWFTDPTYGIDSDYEGDKGESETQGNLVYCLKNGKVHVVARDFEQPNGLAFSPDERRLYIVDTGRTHRPKDGPAHIRVFNVGEDGITLTGGEVFIECLTGLYDGFRFDSTGNIWTSAGNGVSCYDGNTGTLLGRIRVPEIVANVCFGGGIKRNILYICATTSLYSIRLAVNGYIDVVDLLEEWEKDGNQSTEKLNAVRDIRNNNNLTSIPDYPDSSQLNVVPKISLLCDMASENNSNSSNYLLGNNNQSRMVTTTSFLHANQYQVPQLRGNQHYLSTPIQYNTLNRIPTKDEKSFRENERRLLGRNVPRFMILHSDFISCRISCILHILLNAPVFLRIMSVLQSRLETNHFNLNLNSHILHERNFFYSLSSMAKAAYEKYQNDNTDISLVNELCYKHDELYSHMKRCVQQDGNEFLTCVMHTLRIIANQVNETESYLKSFDIKFLESVNNHQSEMKYYDSIHVFSNKCDFQQYINEHFVGTVIERTNELSITRTFDLLPEQLLIIVEKPQNGQSIYYPYPTEFETRLNQCYLLTGAIIQQAVSLNYDHFIAVVRRQDVIYLLDGSQIIDRFRINCLSEYFEKVSPQILLYNEIDQSHRSICIFEDPLCGKPVKKAFNNNSVSYETKPVAIPIPPSFSVTHDMNTPVIIRHPIKSIIRFRMPSDSRRKKRVHAVSKVKDCSGQERLYFWPHYKFAGCYLECAWVFIAPDGKIYRSHCQTVRNEGSKQKLENPTYINMDEIKPSDDQWFSLNFDIIKPKLDVLKAKRERINETNEYNQYDDTCQLVRYPDGQVEYIDQDKLLLLRTTGENSKNKSSKKATNNSQDVTPAEVSKCFGMNTLRLAIRRVRKDPVTGEYVPDSDVLFYSNPFKLVSSTFKETDREYNSNLVQITEISPSQISLPSETDQCTINLLYTIPEMYECTSLKDKYLRATILAGTDEKPDLYPDYQMMDNQNRVNYKTFSIKDYSDKITMIIVKRSMTDYYENSNLNQTSDDLRLFHNMSPTVTQNSSTTISANPSMNCFRIQLELCHLSNEELIPYPKLKVKSKIIIDEIASEEVQVFIQSAEFDDIQTNDIDALFESPNDVVSSHFKRQLSEGNNPTIDTSMATYQKHSRIDSQAQIDFRQTN
ncbi:unnamed protein product [Adineta steineri]|uniref:SMP-30/Gluconolactonase/LRE-like region domain-containing protein n=1 Tax=Adineta steineri TaxID=433720 RepID=A0A814HY42_9BILA|nr:unnamed protein product [Adineta steineri]CAF1017686.1 unnamed protein product [Adineta steineri]